MLQGLGNDIIEVQRIQKAVERHGDRFLEKIFTPQERRYCQSHKEAFRHFAGRFAAKEAVVKALGTGFQKGLMWTDVEILNDVQGKPGVFFSNAFIDLWGPRHVLISISHCHAYATAVAIWI